MQLNRLPTFDELTAENFEMFASSVNSVQIDDSEFESFLETHPDECDKVIEEFQNFSVGKLRDQLTQPVLESLPFPYQTTNVKWRQKELIDWLKRHRSMQTNNIDLLRQRLTNHFKVKVHERSFINQERVRSIIDRHLKAAKESVANHVSAKEMASKRLSKKIAYIIEKNQQPQRSVLGVPRAREPARSELELRLDKVVWPIKNCNMWNRPQVRTVNQVPSISSQVPVRSTDPVPVCTAVRSSDQVPQHVSCDSEDETNLVELERVL